MELKYPLIPMTSFNIDSCWQVKYADVEANSGNVVTPTQVKSQPQLSWSAEEGAFYTVCMTGGCVLYPKLFTPTTFSSEQKHYTD